jgi:ABC-2 type transport system permease protein
MRSAIAMIRARWIAARSYRLRMIFSVASLLVSIVPLYFVANALQPIMAEKIAAEGGQYFGFLVVGMTTYLLLPVAVNALANEVGAGISTGVLEAILGTRSRLPGIFAGMIGFDLLWTGLRACIMLVTAWILGAAILWSQIGTALLILALIVLAYLPFGLIGSAMVIAFRTTGPLPQGVLTISALLGGVYYPTQVIPSWIESVSAFVPLTYGLRALRHTILEGLPLTAVLPDLGVLCVFVVVLMGVGAISIRGALAYARRAGTLSHY